MEKVYLTMKQSGTVGLVLGIMIICAGITSTICGAFIISSGAKLLKSKETLTF